MEDIQSKIGALLNDPETMQKIMAMAQALGQSSHKEATEPVKHEQQPTHDPPGFSLPDIDLGTIQKIAGLTQKAGIDHNQKALLAALGPYLSHTRITKLEKAMRAAKMASLASSLLGSGQLLSSQGR